MASRLSLDPVVRAAWHPVAVAHGIAVGELRAITLLGEDVVIWRGAEGVHAWQDLCVHRGVKLSLGKVVDGCSLRCAYHGWTYNEEGRCIHMPAHPSLTPPSRARVKIFACEERAGLVWVSLDASPGEVPSLIEDADPAFRAIPCGPYPAPAGAPRLIENFLDVAHLPIVHEGLLGVCSRAEIAPYEVEFVEGRPLARDIRIFQPNPEGFAQPGEVAYEYGILAPFVVYLRKRTGSGCFTLLFAVAPVSEVESLGCFTVFMNYGDPAGDADIVAFQEKIFAQDLPVVGSQRPERLPLDLAEELHLPSDRLAIAYRQYIRKLGLTFGTA
jgi:phenylpropionate dioxygenase-like ring-hydroxylating dioxygenase large terminal subunit